MKHLLIIIGFVLLGLGFADARIGFLSGNFEIAFDPYYLICSIGLILIVVHFIILEVQDKLSEKDKDLEMKSITLRNLQNDFNRINNKKNELQIELDVTKVQYSDLRTKNRSTLNKFKDSQNQLNKCIKQISELESEKGKLKRQLQSANANFAKYKKKK